MHPPSQSYNDMQSPNEMVVDTDDYVGNADAPEQDPVAIINPDQLEIETVEPARDLVKATDRSYSLATPWAPGQ